MIAEILAERSDALILLSATPHDGKAKSFASLMNMLDPTAIANPDEYTREDIEGLFVRRFKADVHEQMGTAFPERVIAKAHARASAAEEAAFDALASLDFSKLDQHRGGYGQEHTPRIVYLLTDANNPAIKGDTRILELLIDRDQQATRNIGDPSALMGVYDIDAQELITAQAMESDESDEHFLRRLGGDTSLDPFELLLGSAAARDSLVAAMMRMSAVSCREAPSGK